MFDLISISEAFSYVHEGTGILVDVRPEEIYRKGHLPGAVHLPLTDIMDGNYHLDRGKRILLYCDSGSHSIIAAKRLDRDGYEACSISGGISAYKGTLAVDTSFFNQ